MAIYAGGKERLLRAHFAVEKAYEEAVAFLESW